MFRKVVKSKKGPTSRIRRRRTSEDSSDEDDNNDNDNDNHEDSRTLHDAQEESVQARISRVQKKQRLLKSLPLVATNEKGIFTGRAKSVQSELGTENQEKQDEEDANLSVLAKKQKQAMEDFIERQLIQKDGEKGSTSESKQEEQQKQQQQPKSAEEALYQELAAATVPSKLFSGAEDGVVADDSKGAILVGGTGIAEVVLPKQTSQASTFKAAGTDTNTAKVLRRDWAIHRKDPGSSSSVPLPSKNNRLETKDKSVAMSAALPPTTAFRSMVPGGGSGGGAKTVDVKDTSATEDATSSSATLDDERLGFDAYRKTKHHSQRQQSSSTKPQSNSTSSKNQKTQQRDHDFFVKFIKRQRGKR